MKGKSLELIIEDETLPYLPRSVAKSYPIWKELIEDLADRYISRCGTKEHKEILE